MKVGNHEVVVALPPTGVVRWAGGGEARSYVAYR